MNKKIQSKSILSTLKEPDTFFGAKYTMNLYRGCSHQCIYCDSRSECYQVEDFNNTIEIKTNAIELLNKELCRKKKKGTISTGSMNDPYMPIEKKYELTRQALKAIYLNRFPVHIITKGALVTRDIDLLTDIQKVYAAVSFSLCTPHDDISKKIEPGAPLSSERLEAMHTLAAQGIYTGCTLMPTLPFITDSHNSMKTLITQVIDSGAQYIIPGFGLTLRDRQRDHYFTELDRKFPGVKEQYLNTYGTKHSCLPNNHRELKQELEEICYVRGVPTHIQHFTEETAEQFELFA